MLAFCALCIVLTDQRAVWIKIRYSAIVPSKIWSRKTNCRMYGFVLSHAANSFGIAVLLMYFFKPVSKKWLWVFPLWVIIFCYTRMYLGLHYPADIACGALYGILCGGFIWLYRLSLQQIAKEQTEK